MNFAPFGQRPAMAQSPIQVDPTQDVNNLKLAAIQQYLAAQPKYPGLPQMTPDMAEYYIMQNGGLGQMQPPPQPQENPLGHWAMLKALARQLYTGEGAGKPMVAEQNATGGMLGSGRTGNRGYQDQLDEINREKN